MKYLKLIALFLISCFVFISCKKDKSEKIQFQESFRLDGTLITVEKPAAVVGSGILHIRAASSPVQINCDAKVGTYNLATDLSHTAEQMNSLAGFYSPSNFAHVYDYYFSSSGSVTITKITADYVSGNFQFTGQPLAGNAKHITDGQFTINLKGDAN
jgi:hypothetical protein